MQSIAKQTMVNFFILNELTNPLDLKFLKL